MADKRPEPPKVKPYPSVRADDACEAPAAPREARPFETGAQDDDQSKEGVEKSLLGQQGDPAEGRR